MFWFDIVAFFSAFFIGFLGSVHCLGMCGSIVIFLSKITYNNIFIYQFYYNIGRLLAYLFAGLLINSLGFILLDFFGNQITLFFKGLGGIFLIGFGFYLLGIINFLHFFEKLILTLLLYIFPNIRKKKKISTFRRALTLGFIWGHLPCGLVYSILILSVGAGSFLKGMIIIACFALGTLPSMITIGIFYSKLKQFFIDDKLRILIGLVIIFFGFYNIFSAYFGKCH